MYEIPSQYISKKDREKSVKLNFSKGNYSCKSRSSVTKRKLDLYYVMTNLSYQISSQYLKRQQRKVRQTKFKQREITPVKVGQA